jgi:hypothetical protein
VGTGDVDLVNVAVGEGVALAEGDKVGVLDAVAFSAANATPPWPPDGFVPPGRLEVGVEPVPVTITVAVELINGTKLKA